MIKPSEIQSKARKFAVRDTQIEKDYVLSWILNGIAQHKNLSQHLILKGGTLLKKSYFRNYRFSEDLDFTLIEEAIGREEIYNGFTEIFKLILDEANIFLEIIKDNELLHGGINFYIGFVGPLGGFGANKKIKVDISKEEILEFEPKRRDLFLSYSDLQVHSLLCYSREEVLTEKMRSIIQRTQPRDLYDLWHLLSIEKMDIELYQSEFERKTIRKGINPKELPNKLLGKMKAYKNRWHGSLGDQINDLPDFDTVFREVNREIRKLKFK